MGGGRLGPSPFDLMTAALAECTAMTVRWFARQQDWPLEHVEVTVDHAKKLIAGCVMRPARERRSRNDALPSERCSRTRTGVGLLDVSSRWRSGSAAFGGTVLRDAER
ncbi:OsmC family protein [Mesorhizobium robiniae]|uniref:OsmC family protein n=1 Tax=Mesorhizobium robiniae TaxID=559315 RepID=UPI003397738D